MSVECYLIRIYSFFPGTMGANLFPCRCGEGGAERVTGGGFNHRRCEMWINVVCREENTE